jgi:hypothetical protein
MCLFNDRGFLLFLIQILYKHFEVSLENLQVLNAARSGFSSEIRFKNVFFNCFECEGIKMGFIFV